MFGSHSDPRGVTKSLKYPPSTALSDLVVLITGANAGIGLATAAYLYSHGANVVIGCRSAQKAQLAIAQLEANPAAQDEAGVEITKGTLEFVPLDLASFDSAKELVNKWESRQNKKLDILICNAGCIHLDKTVTPDNFEMMYQTNYLTHSLLTLLFLPYLALAPQPRLINVSSYGAYRPMVHANLNSTFEKSWNPLARFTKGIDIYATTKLLQVSFAQSLHAILSTHPPYEKIIVQSLHPGVVNSSIASTLFPSFLSSVIAKVFGMVGRTVEQGAMTSIWVALSDEAKVSGQFWADCAVAEMPSGAGDPGERAKIFERTLKDIGMVGWKLE